MADTNVFPHEIYANDKYGWADSPKLAVDLWHKINTKKIGWYAVDLEILSPKAVKIHVRDMADNFSGGIGQVIETHEFSNLTTKQQDELDKILLAVYTQYAEYEYYRRQEEEKRKAIAQVRQELFGV